MTAIARLMDRANLMDASAMPQAIVEDLALAEFLPAAMDGLNHLAVYVTAPARDDVIVYANAACAAYFGVPVAGLIGVPLRRFVDTGDREYFRHFVERIRTQKTLNIDSRVHRNGEDFDAQVSLARFLYRGEEFVLAVAQERHSGQDLRDAEIVAVRSDEEARFRQRLSQHAEAAPGAMFSLACGEDGIFRLLYATARYCELMGVEPDVVRTDPARLLEGVHPDDRAVVAQHLAQSRADGVVQVEFRSIPGQGDPRWIRLMARAERSSGGEHFLHGYLLDVTEQKRQDAAFVAGELTYRHVFDNTSDSILVVDVGTHPRAVVVTAANAASAAILGVAPADLIGRPLSDAKLPGDFTDVIGAHMARAVLTGETLTCRHAVMFPVGLLRLRFQFVPMIDEAVATRRVIIFIRDFTREHAAEQERLEHERNFFNLVEESPDPIVRYDGLLQRIYANRAFMTLMAGTGVSSGFAGQQEGLADISAHLVRVASGTTTEEFELNLPQRDGRQRAFAIRAFREVAADGVQAGFVTIWRDATERYRIAKRLAQRERDFRQLVENAPDCVARYDINGRCIYENPSHMARVGGPHGDFPSLTPANRNRFLDAIDSVSRTGRPCELELEHCDPVTGTWVSFTRFVPELASNGAIASVLVIGRDVSEMASYRERLRRAAFFDSLTGLPNRAMLYEEAARRLTAGLPLTLLILDLDGFKEVNDGLGHEAGDSLLRIVARRLEHCAPEASLVARLGGDEFALIHTDDTGLQGQEIAARILAALMEPTDIAGRRIFVSASIGISRSPIDCSEFDQLLRNADAAMYRAKAAGRNNFQVYTADMTARAIERMMLAGSLRRAETRGELVLNYQPQVDLATRRVQGAEALLRWHHPDLGVIMPDRFISIAEETGLIVNIGAWVLREACRMAVYWNRQRTTPIQVAVNLSGRQFTLNDMAATVRDVLAETGCRPQWIELEITETTLIADEALVSQLTALAALGISIALDDFGTGYSALGYLSRFPISKLKIDRSFMVGIDTDRKKRNIVRAITSIASALDMRLIAEGVETEDQLRFLRTIGCQAGQGYLFGRPMSGAQFSASWAMDSESGIAG